MKDLTPVPRSRVTADSGCGRSQSANAGGVESDAIKASEPKVPWRAIAGFRNILVHDYLAIDVDAVWLVVDQELPRLRAALQRMQKRSPVI